MAKWSRASALDLGEIPADAVTADLRTQNNTLSFWRFGTDSGSSIDDAALAIAAGGNRIDRFFLVCLRDEELHDDNQVLCDTVGRTPVDDLTDLHVDVCGLDYVRLGKVARRILTAVEENRYCCLTKRRILDLIVSAVQQDRVNLEDLADRIQSEVKRTMTR